MRPTRTAALAAALLVAAGVTAGHVQAQPSDDATSPAEPTEQAQPGQEGQPAAAPAGPKTTIDGDGTYAVGKDIVPGNYASAGPVPDSACYWKRTSGDQMVDNAMSKKPQVVQIMAGDTSFTTNDCQPWQLTNAPVPNPGSATDILGQLGKLILTNPSGPPTGPPAGQSPAGSDESSLPAEAPAPAQGPVGTGRAPGPTP